MPKLDASEFVLLDKKPTDSDEDPYCYDPTYSEVGGGKLTIVTSRALVSRGDLEHAVNPVSALDRKRLTHVLDTLRQWQLRQ